MYSRETQKLIYWIMSDICNFNNGLEVGSTPNEIQMRDTKKQLKQEYIKLFDYKLEKEPLNNFLKLLEDKDNLTVEELQKRYIVSIQSVFLKHDDFSLALELMTQEKANKFVAYLFELCLNFNIPFRKEIAELFQKTQNERYQYICLLKKICCICGKQGELEHVENVSRIGGYKFDDGLQNSFMCLCREHHSEAHAIGKDAFKEKYLVEGIRLKPEQVEKLKKVYTNHFKAFNKEEHIEEKRLFSSEYYMEDRR